MEFWEYITAPYKEYPTALIWMESIASVFGIISVLFSSQRKIWVYPFGIISTLIFIYIYYRFNLLGNMFINVYYTVMSIYGWVLWHQNVKENQELQVSRMTAKEWITAGVIFIGSGIFVYLNYHFQPEIFKLFGKSITEEFQLDLTKALDLLTTSIFFAAMWMMAKAKVENWVLWIIGDIICTLMLFRSELYISGIQFIILTLLAIRGYRMWKRTA